MANLVVWFDIPVKDLKRATQFYEQVLNLEIEISEEYQMAVLPHSGNDVAGCLVVDKPEVNAPSGKGALLYFNVEGRMADACKKATANGGSILEAAQKIGEHGFRAVIKDSEGNRVALHASTSK